MNLPRFDLVEPSTVEGVCKALQDNDNSRVIAGGTDLLVNIKKKVFTVDTLVSLGNVSELKELSFSKEKGLTIGASVRVIEVIDSPEVNQFFPALSAAANKLGSWQIRNRATVGGNVCSARPAADTIGPLIAYGAVAKIAGPKGTREALVETIFVGPGKTTLAKGEFLTSINVKLPANNTGVTYAKYGTRQAMEIAIVSVTTLVTRENNAAKTARVVLGAVAPTYVRCTKTEDFLTGKTITEDIAEQAGQIASQSCAPITDIRASAEYRRQLVKVMVKRNLLASVGANK